MHTRSYCRMDGCGLPSRNKLCAPRHIYNILPSTRYGHVVMLFTRCYTCNNVRYMEATVSKSNYYDVAELHVKTKDETIRLVSRTYKRTKRACGMVRKKAVQVPNLNRVFSKWKSVVLITRKFSKRLPLPPPPTPRLTPPSSGSYITLAAVSLCSHRRRRRRRLSFARAFAPRRCPFVGTEIPFVRGILCWPTYLAALLYNNNII